MLGARYDDDDENDDDLDMISLFITSWISIIVQHGACFPSQTGFPTDSTLIIIRCRMNEYRRTVRLPSGTRKIFQLVNIIVYIFPNARRGQAIMERNLVLGFLVQWLIG